MNLKRGIDMFLSNRLQHNTRVWIIALIVAAFCGSGILPVRVAAEETSDYVHYRLGVKYKNERKVLSRTSVQGGEKASKASISGWR